MSQRFEGATTTPDDDVPDPSLVPGPERPPRPVLVELGAAILIVGGITALVGWAGSQIVGTSIPADAGLPTAVFIGLNLVSMPTGTLIRDGRNWRVCITIVAVAVFLYLMAFPNPQAVFFGVLDAVVFFALVRHRAWFEWKPRETSRASGES